MNNNEQYFEKNYNIFSFLKLKLKFKTILALKSNCNLIFIKSINR
jgi:hypothetical protein